MYKYPALNATIEHHPRPTTVILTPDHHRSKMSSSPSLLAQSKLEPPPNLHSQSYDDHEPVDYPQFMLLGDSITQFSTLTFQSYLQTIYIRRADVINRGLSGFTAPMGFRALKNVLSSKTSQPCSSNIKLATVFFGANDACIPGESQHVDLPRYVSAIKKIVEYPGFKNERSRTEIIVITPPPVNEHQFSQLPSGSFQRRAGTTSQYAQASLEAFQGLDGVYVLDFWSVLMRHVGWTESMGRDCCCEHLPRDIKTQSYAQSPVQHIPGCYHCPAILPGANYQLSDFLCDGLHLTKLGYDVLFEGLMSLIRKEIPDCAPENMPYILPEWRDALSWDEASDVD